MIQPKPYPPTDSAEQNAKLVFENLIDRNIVKTDIRVRDKYPNVDGTAELVDERQLPIGKLDIQLRTIPKGQTSYSCNTSLVAYSTSSTLPVILICVDSTNNRAYWKHVHASMPEVIGKENQQTFVIHFVAESDIIDQNGAYIQKWIEIARDYQERIAKYPTLRSELANKVDLKGVEPTDLELFQRYIDTVNRLLDNDFITVKRLLFPGVWKLGVTIISSVQPRLQYRMYTIPYGGPSSTLISKSDRGFLFTDQWSSNAVSETLTHKQEIVDPEKLGKNFVFDEVREAVEKMALPVYGTMLSADILVAFVDRYHRVLGIAPYLESYSVQELAYALNQRLTAMGAAIIRKITSGSGSGFTIDLDWFSRYLETNTIEPVVPSQPSVYFSLISKYFPVRLAFDSLQYLLANQISTISRPFGQRDLPRSSGGKWIWSGYTREREIGNVTGILQHSLEEYSAFVTGNQFHFPNSPYLDPNTSIIFEYEPVKGTAYEDGPGLNEYHIDNSAHTLPKLSIFAKDDKLPRLQVGTSLEGQFYTVEFEGKTHKCHSISYSVGSFLFDTTPVLNLMYRMLAKDLSRHYDITISLARL